MRNKPEHPATSKRPKIGMWIVWRFKDSKSWSVGYVRESYGAGYVVHLTDSEYASDYNGYKVCVDDIDWKTK